MLGELALIADTKRLTSAEAATDAEVLRINRTMFRRILEEYPETAERCAPQIIEDLQALIRRIEQVGEQAGRRSDCGHFVLCALRPARSA